MASVPPCIIYPSFNFDGEKYAERYMLPAYHYTLAPSQVTIYAVDGDYEKVLNVEGCNLLSKTRECVKNAQIKGRLRGSLQPSRTGFMMHDNGAASLCSWQNRVYVGRNVDSFDEKEIQTSPILLFELDEKECGWILTKSGSVYLVEPK